VISMLFERGEFDQRSVELTAWALLWYTAGLVSHSLVEILSRAFYALHDTKTPVLVGTAAMSLNVVLSLTLPGWFTSWGWLPHGGLALANTLATTLEMIALILLMSRRLNGLHGSYIWKGTAKTILASAVMSGVILSWLVWVSGSSVWLVGLGGIVVGGLVYGVFMIVFRVPEVRELLGVVGKRLGFVKNF